MRPNSVPNAPAAPSCRRTHSAGVAGAATGALFALAVMVVLGGCGGGGADADSAAAVDGAALVAVDLSVDGSSAVALNQPLVWEFSAPVRRSSVRHDTFQIRSGVGFGRQAEGRFIVSGRRVTFLPRLPERADLSDAGFHPSTTYRVTVAAHPSPSAPLSTSGAPLATPVVAYFTTADAHSPDLFTSEGLVFEAPRPRRFRPSLGERDARANSPVRVEWSAPLDPRTVTSETVTLVMTDRRGEPWDMPIRGTPVLHQDHRRVEVQFLPLNPLPSEASFELRFSPAVTHLVRGVPLGEPPGSGSSNTAGDRDVRAYHWWSTGEEHLRFHRTTLRFDGGDRDQDDGPGVDRSRTSASFDEDVPGAVAARFVAAGGDGRLGEFRPEADTELSTNSPYAVAGTFAFRSIHIAEGVDVTLRGPLPAHLLSAGAVTVDGTLRADGGRGSDGEADTTSTFAAATGGAAGPGGGAGGEPYTGPDWSGAVGGSGGDSAFGGAGGGGGHGATPAYGGFGGGGGGGGGAAPGTGGQHGQYPTRSSWNAGGGAGGGAGGIDPTSSLTRDGREFHRLGAGGGGGGSGGTGTNYPKSKGHLNGAASGGGGGGALLLQSGGDITVRGTVSAAGGDGGDAGAGAVTNYGGAAGGGGGGGTVAMYAAGDLLLDGGTLSARGGEGGASSGNLWPGTGGAGAAGRLRLEDADGTPGGLASATLLVDDYTTGSFRPVASVDDAPSVFTGTWCDSGLFDATLLPLLPFDVMESVPSGTGVRIEIQMAATSPDNGLRADTAALAPDGEATTDSGRVSPWTVLRDEHGTATSGDDLAPLRNRGFRFFRVRFTFVLAEGSTLEDPLPFVDELRLRWLF